MWHLSNRIQSAVIFAWEKHFGQKRDGGNPYFVHLDRVAHIVSQYNHTEDVLMAAYLHDTVEDTDCTIEDIVEKFGQGVADMVFQLTNTYSDHLEFDAKSKATLEHAQHITIREAKLIKLADRLDNLRDCHHWKYVRQAKYILNTKLLLEGLGEIPLEYLSLAEAIKSHCRMLSDKNEQIQKFIREHAMNENTGTLFA